MTNSSSGIITKLPLSVRKGSFLNPQPSEMPSIACKVWFWFFSPSPPLFLFRSPSTSQLWWPKAVRSCEDLSCCQHTCTSKCTICPVSTWPCRTDNKHKIIIQQSNYTTSRTINQNRPMLRSPGGSRREGEVTKVAGSEKVVTGTKNRPQTVNTGKHYGKMWFTPLVDEWSLAVTM